MQEHDNEMFDVAVNQKINIVEGQKRIARAASQQRG